MDALPTSPEDRASLVARYEPLQEACDDLYARLVEALPDVHRRAAAKNLRMLRDAEIVTDEYDQEVLDDYALHMALAGRETFLTRKLAEGFVEEGSEDERLLRALSRARFSFFEIIEIIPGLGVELYDLIRDCRTHVVATEEWPEGVGPGHHFMSRLMDVDGITMLACPGFPIPEVIAIDLAHTLRAESAIDPVPPDSREPWWLSQTFIEVMMKIKNEAFDDDDEAATPKKLGLDDPCRCGSRSSFRECCAKVN